MLFAPLRIDYFRVVFFGETMMNVFLVFSFFVYTKTVYNRFKLILYKRGDRGRGKSEQQNYCIWYRFEGKTIALERRDAKL